VELPLTTSTGKFIATISKLVQRNRPYGTNTYEGMLLAEGQLKGRAGRTQV
jgi:hypothetical protein